MIPIDGIVRWRRGTIAWIQIVDGEIYEIAYQPDEDEIRKLCVKYGLPSERVLEVVNARDFETYGLLFELERFREYLKENPL